MRATPWRVAPLLGLLAAAAHAATVQVTVTDPSGRPLPDAVVFLESAAARAAVKPAMGVEIAQAGRRFQPLVTVVPVGTSVHFPNRDTVRHHVYSLSPTKRFEIKLYIGTPADPVVFDKPGIAVLGCNIHDSMVGWTVVVDTPWYGKAADDGRVTIDAVPAGSYRLRSWHGSLPVGTPAADQAITVGPAAMALTVKLAGASPL